MRQWHCYVNGQQYGPVDDDVLREWAQTGRLGPTDNVWTEGMADWAPAGTVGGLFGPVAVSAMPTYTRPHRGGTVLTMGILGLACCIIFAIIAWAMGSSDLRDMTAGHMDRTGEGMTRAGLICGIIGVIVGILAIIGGIVAGLADM